MKNIILLLTTIFLISFSSCRTDFSTVASSGNLEFSKTKVYLDTVFNNTGSSTYGLKVYNRSSDDIKIPVIKFGNGLNSRYRMMVDGMTGNQGKIFDNVEILAKDSLFIFIEFTNPDPNPVQLQFTYDDQILFDVGSNQQKVDLTTLIWDAKFIFPNRTLNPTLYETISVNGFKPDTNGHTLVSADFTGGTPWHFTNTKPYVIYGNCVVPNGQTLTIDKGARVYFHSEATLIVDNGATLKIEGEQNILDANSVITTRNEVTFEGDRLEPFFEDVPGQWGAVFLLSGQNNTIDYLKLKNAVVGLYSVNNSAMAPRLTITNSQIYNCSNYGLLAKNSIITGTNLVINNAGQSTLACSEFGPYNFTHCTFNNNWSSSKQTAVYLNDYYINDNNQAVTSGITANFKNCIIYGSNNIEVILDKKSTSITNSFITSFNYNLVRFDDANASSSIKTDQNYSTIRNQSSGNIKNVSPKFKNADKNKLNILIGSPAINSGLNLSPNFNDILNVPRPTPPNTNPDIGAYQFVP